METSNTNKDLKKIENIIKISKGYCCACLTFNELEKLDRKEFISIMKEMFKSISEHKLTSPRIRSWRDEFKEIKYKMIPILKTNRKINMKMHLIFEMKMPSKMTKVETSKPLYCDVVIVTNNSYAVLEFKQRTNEVLKHYYSEALKYDRRLRYHKVLKHFKNRYVYMVNTHEKNTKIDKYRKVKGGNSISVAKDMLEGLLKKNKPYNDIEFLLNAGFVNKKTRANSKNKKPIIY